MFKENAPATTAVDVAQYLICYNAPVSDSYELQQLVIVCQGLYLAKFGERLFVDEITKGGKHLTVASIGNSYNSSNSLNDSYNEVNVYHGSCRNLTKAQIFFLDIVIALIKDRGFKHVEFMVIELHAKCLSSIVEKQDMQTVFTRWLTPIDRDYGLFKLTNILYKATMGTLCISFLLVLVASTLSLLAVGLSLLLFVACIIFGLNINKIAEYLNNRKKW